MTTSRLPLLALLPLLASLGACTHSTPPQPPPQPTTTTAVDAGLQQAVAIAIPALHQQSHYPQDGYILTSAQQIVRNGRYTWSITFKPTDLLPKDPSHEHIGAGGEVFVNVDLVTKKPEIRYGE